MLPCLSNKLSDLKHQVSYFLNIIKIADPAFSILICNNVYERRDEVTRIDNQVLSTDKDIPSTMTRINKFLDMVQLKKDCLEQRVWCQIQIGCNKEPKN